MFINTLHVHKYMYTYITYSVSDKYNYVKLTSKVLNGIYAEINVYFMQDFDGNFKRRVNSEEIVRCLCELSSAAEASSVSASCVVVVRTNPCLSVPGGMTNIRHVRAHHMRAPYYACARNESDNSVETSLFLSTNLTDFGSFLWSEIASLQSCRVVYMYVHVTRIYHLDTASARL